MVKEVKQTIINNLINIAGWRTSRKIIVIESDDWGSIRMPSKDIFNKCVSLGYNMFDKPYERYDSLATVEDLSKLFEVLIKYKDINGNHPVFTALTIVSNPDFKKITESNYKQYHYEPFTNTLERYPNHKKSFRLWEKGISQNIFFPQFHGREHVNVQKWLKLLQNKDQDCIIAFNLGMTGIFPKRNNKLNNPLTSALRFTSKQEIPFLQTSINEGLNLFEEIFGYKSQSFMAPAYTWNEDIEKILNDNRVKYIQSAFYQNKPLYNGKNSVVHHYLGEKNQNNQRYLLRNCSFEPSIYPRLDAVNNCLKEINTAFKWKKPATISSHRVNYIGSISMENRDRNLKMLDVLLKTIHKKWPDVEFVNSVQLGNIIHN
jgi:hypothetical protein